MRIYVLFSLIALVVGCAPSEKIQTEEKEKAIYLEKIAYYKYQEGIQDSVPYQYKVTYAYDNGKPYRWIDLDSLGKIQTDYIYVYDSAWVQTGAKYIEPGEEEYAIERNRFENDSTLVTEWIDKDGKVFYSMIDNLNAAGETYAATFIGDTIHGRDSTFYTENGHISRIFFTNNKGKILNDRSFTYDSITAHGEWVKRQKIMADTIREIHKRDWYTNDDPYKGIYYPGIISSGEWDENSMSITSDGNYAFFTRTNDWTHQHGFLAERHYGQWQTPELIPQLDTIYNGAISPDGSKLIFCTNERDLNPVWLMEKKGGQWQDPDPLGISGGYFHWVSNTEIAYYVHDNKGDLAFATLNGKILSQTNYLASLNTASTEFSPYLDPEKRFVIFTRYVIDDIDQQGIFLSRNTGTRSQPQWEDPIKLNLPYGWGAFIVGDLEAILYSDGEDIYQVPWKDLDLPFEL